MSVMSPSACESSKRWDATAFFAERRRSPRFEAGEERLWMGWWNSDLEFRVDGVILRNVSRTGAAARMAAGPELGQEVWLRIEGPQSIGCVAGRVVGVDAVDDSQDLVRVEFLGECPEVFFEAAIVAA
jgi:hypothetical protein